MVGSDNHLRVKYYMWPHISGQVLQKTSIDLSRCYISVKNGPVFGKKADMDTTYSHIYKNKVTG